MEELIGFVASNNKLSKILAVLDSKGPMDSATIAKTTRIVGAQKNIEELVEKKLMAEESGIYSLTELGKEVIHKYRGVR
jgi:predicted transcriptional regulator